MPELSPGTPLDDRFTLVRRLGRGGMAEVWLARDAELDEDVVLKIVDAPAGEDRLAWLRRECRHTRRLVHPNIVRVFDFRRSGERGFVVMEHVDGEDARALRGAPADAIVRALIPVADAIAYAHDQDVVHRDLKPANILLDAGGRPKVVDFGIAGILDPAREATDVRGGGTRAYAGPQQRAGEPPAPSDDVFSLGAVLDDLLPTAGVPPRLRRLVDAMTAEDVAIRPADMGAVAETLRACERDVVERDGTTQPAQASPPAEVTRPATGIAPPTASPGPSPRLAPPPRVASIEPTPPPAAAEAVRPARARRSHGFPWKTTLGIAALILVAVAVIVLLPRWANRPASAPGAGTGGAANLPAIEMPAAGETTPTDPAPATGTRPDLDARFDDEARERVAPALHRASTLRDDLESRGGADWGGDTWARALARIADGDARFQDGAYGDAATAYGDAADLLQSVEAMASDVVNDAIIDGRRHLDAGNAAAAQAAFRRALAIDPGDSDARAGLRRAEVLDDVVSHLDAAAAAERSGDLDAALREFGQAAALDPSNAVAQDGMARVTAALENDAFAGAMSAGLSALREGAYDRARTEFRRAAAMRPGAPEIADAMTRVDNAERISAIGRHGDAARLAESEEDWDRAVTEYEAVLRLDPAVGFAQDGLERSKDLADLATRVDYHLANPDRLISDAVYAEAGELLDELRAEPSTGPVHDRRLRAFEALVRAGATEVRVVLQSDGETEVAVYHVGRLGTFTTRELMLRPGRYTVVGSRRGYRDVRHTLVVSATAPPAPLVVRCEDAL